MLLPPRGTIAAEHESAEAAPHRPCARDAQHLQEEDDDVQEGVGTGVLVVCVRESQAELDEEDVEADHEAQHARSDKPAPFPGQQPGVVSAELLPKFHRQLEPLRYVGHQHRRSLAKMRALPRMRFPYQSCGESGLKKIVIQKVIG